MKSAELHQVVVQWRAPMLGLAARLIQPRELAEDIVQQTLLSLLEAPEGLIRARDPRLYAFGALKFKITDALRQRYRQPPSVCPGPEEDLDDLLFKENGHWEDTAAPVPWNNPERSMQSDQFFAVVDACVKHLPDKPAKVFGMKVLLEFEAEEVCSTLSISKNDYWQCLSRARKQLQQCLQQRWFNTVATP